MAVSFEDPFETWNPARLIPTAGIRGQEEQERRATSALLAVLKAVPEFAHSLLRELGAPKGRISTFTEVQLRDDEGRLSIPDGAIVVERGRTRWAVLVEVKTGDAPLPDEQVSRYLDHARALGFDGVLTINNRITSDVTDSSVTVDRRKLRTLSLWHLSWWRIMTEAVVQHRYRGISDPDQAWILGELIAYLDHEASGAGGFTDMGDKWVRVRDAAHNGTLRAADPEARGVAQRWEQFGEYLALGLSQDLGRDVLEREVRQLSVHPRRVHGDDVRVVEARGGARLVGEARGGGRGEALEELEGEPAPQQLVDREVDRAHAALGHQPRQAKPIDHHARRQRSHHVQGNSTRTLFTTPAST